MKRFTGETSNGVYEVILIDNSLAMEYVALGGGGWQAQKTEYRMPTADSISIEHYLFGDIDTSEEEEDPIACQVTEGKDGEELTVKLTNLQTQKSAEWVFTDESSYGPLFRDKWGNLLHDVMRRK